MLVIVVTAEVGAFSRVISCSLPWRPPSWGSFSLSIDDAVTLSRGFASCGGVVHDEEGTVWVAWAIAAEGEFSVEVAELLALRVGLQWADSLGYIMSVSETDSVCVCNWVNSPSSIFLFRPIIIEIVSLLAAVGGGSCRTISRNANGVANTLAKFVTSSIGVNVWTDTYSKFISAPVTVDLVR
uniref:RNase H type-1 domain-containing protein n=1 Tax=Cannabis sativa TaxID=3483 RepID=A0A803NJ90_CANSA